ncbi:hypothetical protein BDV39DRAFT_168876 [Aspergillus sergii]|uniref:Transmembrane protein n=1 Tax=Aspergillus sergii TaxID=1034303 RepID=A0A5N6XGP6_9EURO|nr:hypothetical protein BDV39DRAFT_168876 [Aspergillus sergii]
MTSAKEGHKKKRKTTQIVVSASAPIKLHCRPMSNHACYGCNNLLYVILGFFSFLFAARSADF